MRIPCVPLGAAVLACQGCDGGAASSPRGVASAGGALALMAEGDDMSSAAMNEALDELEAVHTAHLRAAPATAKWLEDAPENTAPADKLWVTFGRRGSVRSLTALGAAWPSGLDARAAPAEHALAFCQRWTSIFKSAELELTATGTIERPDGSWAVGLQQTHVGVPVFGGSIIVQGNADSTIRSLAGNIVPDGALPEEAPSVAVEDAASIAAASMLPGLVEHVDEGRLGLFDLSSDEDPDAKTEFAHEFVVSAEDESKVVYVSACTGKVLAVERTTNDLATKEVYWLNHTLFPLPGTPVCSDPTCDCGANYDGTSELSCGLTQAVYDYYYSQFGRDGWDNDPASPTHRMRISSDWGAAGNLNAQWNRTDLQVVVGDSANCNDVLSHEWTHAVNQAADGNGADVANPMLNEGLADAMASFFEIWRTGSTDWKLKTGSTCSQTVRDMAVPSSLFDQNYQEVYPDHWSNFNYEDVYGNHNATIVGKAAHLLGRGPGEGSTTHWGRTVTGLGPSTAQYLFYDTLTTRLSSSADLTELRNGLLESAADSYGVFSSQWNTVDAATQAIGTFTSDVSSGFDSPYAPRVEYFSVSGQNRRWMFYVDRATSEVMYTYRTCVLYGACSWQTPQTVYALPVASSPATVQYDGKLWVFFVPTSTGQIAYKTIDSAGTLSGTASLGISTDAAVAATAFAGKLYLIWKTAGSSEQSIKFSSYLTSWSGTSTVPWPTATDGGIDAVWGGSPSLLWLAYQRFDGTAIRVAVRTMTTSGTWNSEVFVPTSVSTKAPAVDFYRNRLHVASTQGTKLYYASCEMPCASGDWTKWVAQNGTTNNWARLDNRGANDGRLYLWHRGPSSSRLYWRYKNSE